MIFINFIITGIAIIIITTTTIETVAAYLIKNANQHVFLHYKIKNFNFHLQDLLNFLLLIYPKLFLLFMWIIAE